MNFRGGPLFRRRFRGWVDHVVVVAAAAAMVVVVVVARDEPIAMLAFGHSLLAAERCLQQSLPCVQRVLWN